MEPTTHSTTADSMNANVRKLTALHVLGQVQIHQPVFALFFLISKGFTLQQFFILLSAFFLTTMLMEIPTGSFSDRTSRKRALVIGALICIPATLTMILSDSFWIVLAAEVVAGIGAAFRSGTDTALLYDSLLAAGREKEFKAVSGRLAWYGGLAMAGGGIAGGLLAQVEIPLAWWASFIIWLPTLLVLVTLREPPVHRTPSDTYLHHLKESARHGLRGEAGYFVLYSATVWMFFSIGYWLWQPYLKLVSAPIAWLGFIYAAMNVVGSVASRHADMVERRIGMRRSLLLIPLLLALAFALEAQAIALLGTAFLALQSLASGFFGPVLGDYVNSRIPSERRATILSLQSMLNNLLFSVLSPLVGYAADAWSLQTTLLLLAGSLSLTAVAFRLCLPRTSATPA